MSAASRQFAQINARLDEIEQILVRQGLAIEDDWSRAITFAPAKGSILQRLDNIEERFKPTSKPATVNPTPGGVQVYVSVPTQIRALRWTGTNGEAIKNWTGGFEYGPIDGSAVLWVDANHAWIEIEIGEWVAQDTHGFYPIKDDIFQMKYREFEGTNG